MSTASVTVIRGGTVWTGGADRTCWRGTMW